MCKIWCKHPLLLYRSFIFGFWTLHTSGFKSLFRPSTGGKTTCLENSVGLDGKQSPFEVNDVLFKIHHWPKSLAVIHTRADQMHVEKKKHTKENTNAKSIAHTYNVSLLHTNCPFQRSPPARGRPWGPLASWEKGCGTFEKKTCSFSFESQTHSTRRRSPFFDFIFRTFFGLVLGFYGFWR